MKKDKIISYSNIPVYQILFHALRFWRLLQTPGWLVQREKKRYVLWQGFDLNPIGLWIFGILFVHINDSYKWENREMRVVAGLLIVVYL